jgi:glutaconyl-CoA/methylmalonyl-CoA decarboxylase subunit gamma
MTRQFKVTVNGREYDVSVLEVTPLSQVATSAGPAGVAHVPAIVPHPAPHPTAHSNAAPAAGPGDIVAGMGGVVVEIHVNAGQSVAAGDRLLVLEAMKMKTQVIATHAGRVTRVLVAPHEAVEGGQVLLTIA